MTAPHHKNIANVRQAPHFEVEQKYTISPALAGALPAPMAALGFVPHASIRLSDTYYNDPSQDFASERISLRLRMVEGRVISLDYRKAVPQDQIANEHAKQEIELAVAGAQPKTADNLLRALGYKEYVTVTKTRTPYTSKRYAGITIDWDVIDMIGIHLELEALVPNVEDIPATEAKLRALAIELGLTPDMLVSKPYRDLVAAAKGVAA